MQAAGVADGDYLLGSAPVAVLDGPAALAGGDSIAGSAFTMGEAVRHAVRRGLAADLAILDDDLHVSGTVVGGTWVHGPLDSARA
jgi:N-acetylglucosamine-6-phosphate deacetylase